MLIQRIHPFFVKPFPLTDKIKDKTHALAQSNVVMLNTLEVSPGSSTGVDLEEQQRLAGWGPTSVSPLYLHCIPDLSHQQAANLPRQQFRSVDGVLHAQGLQQYYCAAWSSDPVFFAVNRNWASQNPTRTNSSRHFLCQNGCQSLTDCPEQLYLGTHRDNTRYCSHWSKLKGLQLNILPRPLSPSQF